MCASRRESGDLPIAGWYKRSSSATPLENVVIDSPATAINDFARRQTWRASQALTAVPTTKIARHTHSHTTGETLPAGVRSR